MRTNRTNSLPLCGEWGGARPAISSTKWGAKFCMVVVMTKWGYFEAFSVYDGSYSQNFSVCRARSKNKNSLIRFKEWQTRYPDWQWNKYVLLWFEVLKQFESEKNARLELTTPTPVVACRVGHSSRAHCAKKVHPVVFSLFCQPLLQKPFTILPKPEIGWHRTCAGVFE